MTREKTTLYLDPQLLRELKAAAKRSGLHEFEIVEDALRRYLTDGDGSAREEPRGFLAQLPARVDLADEEAIELSIGELREVRRERDRGDYGERLRGLHREIWDDVDPQVYVQREREAWRE